MPFRVLFVEDDSSLATVLTDTLHAEGYLVEQVSNGETAVERAAAQSYDLVLLDVCLPGYSGIVACRRMREQHVHTPVLMLSGCGATAEKVLGLNAGADDYLSKPFEPEELLARMRALIRRERTQALATLLEYRFDGVYVDFFRGAARKHGETVSLSFKELHLLRYLIYRRGIVLSREELLREVWGYQATGTRTVDMHIATLRQKLEDDPQRPRRLITVRGEGYMFEE